MNDQAVLVWLAERLERLIRMLDRRGLIRAEDLPAPRGKGVSPQRRRGRRERQG